MVAATGSVHLERVATGRGRAHARGGHAALDYVVAAEVLGAVRKAKSEARRSMRAEVTRVSVTDTPERLAALDRVAADVRGAGRIGAARHEAGDDVRGRRRARLTNRCRVNLPDALDVARRARQPRDRHRRPVGSRSAQALHRRSTRIRALTDLLGSPAAVVPGRAPHRDEREDVGDAHDRGAARRSRPLDRLVHEPASRAGQRADGLAGRADRRRGPRRGADPASPQSRSSCPTGPSYFEILTAAAFDWFADIAVDVAVVEVGLGGTWDSTNVVDAPVAVVTNVSVDHVEYLGETREEIAREKAGIVQQGATLVLGETDPELRAIFDAREPGPDPAPGPRLRGAVATARARGPRARPRRRPAGPTTISSSRSTARTRPTTR